MKKLTKKKIFVTRELTDQQIKIAQDLDLQPIIEPAIEIEFRNNWFVVETALKVTEESYLAFTSQNAVEAFGNFLSTGISLPDKYSIYAVGEKTADALKEIDFEPIIPDQSDATGLAQKIIDDLTSHSDPEKVAVLHFCGDKRRDEFRQFLEKAKVQIRDLVVYETKLNQMNLPAQKPDGYLFFSPSAVEAFRKSGGFQNPDLTNLFAIGPTTAEELSIESGKHVHISPEPITESLLKFVSEVLNRESEISAV